MSTEMMQAVRFHRFGPPEVLVVDSIPRPPSPGAGQVLVRVRAAGVNPIDTAIKTQHPSDLAGWTNYGSSTMVVSNVTDEAATGFRSLRITGKGQSPYASYALRRLFTNSRPTRVSFSVRAAQTNAITGRIWGTAPGPYYLAFDFYMNKDGRMGLYSRNSFVGIPYVSDRWYQVDLDLNWTTRLVNCRIDGALAITNVAFPDETKGPIQASRSSASWMTPELAGRRASPTGEVL